MDLVLNGFDAERTWHRIGFGSVGAESFIRLLPGPVF